MNSSSIQRSIQCETAALFLFVIAWLAALPMRARADAVTDWNVIAFVAVEASGKTGPVTSCDIAMAHVAMHDALNAIDRRYEPYAYDAVAPRDASPEAAVAAAAHDVLVARIPNQKASLDAALASALAAIPDGQSKADGVATGRAAAAAIVARREKNGSPDVTPYTPGEELGVWRPTPPTFALAIGAGFGKVRPFTMTSGAQFDLPTPAYFNLRGAEYAADYNEVKRLGGANSKKRTAEQSEVARFWYEPSPGVHIRLARELVVTSKLDPWKSARLFALLQLASADCLIAGYGAKYRFNFWRPVTAIRDGANDGNPQTAADPKWRSYLETPSHPEYLSNHAVLCAAWAEILARFFGTDQFDFTITSAKPYPGIKRSFTSFSQSAREASDSRVYAGVHFRGSCRDGLVIGHEIGAQTFENFLRPAFDPPAGVSWIDDFIAASMIK
ncbi:MAG TPA: vanadium-dependent haloperoxidase [Blastocatellia bacterium]|nr:vanadium-dependent haloperoxidase [Blastocatellia bacterium]